MKFSEVLGHLERGGAIRRSVWPNNRTWRMIRSIGDGRPCMVERDANLDREVGRYGVEVADLFRDDWELVSGQGQSKAKA